MRCSVCGQKELGSEASSQVAHGRLSRTLVCCAGMTYSWGCAAAAVLDGLPLVAGSSSSRSPAYSRWMPAECLQ